MGKHFRFPVGFGFPMKHIANRFCSGVYISILANPIMEMGEIGDVGRRIGMSSSIVAIGALTGPPISGAIKSATGDFKAVGYYAGGPLKFTSLLRIGIHPSIFRNCCPRGSWYDVNFTASYFAKDVWKDMILKLHNEIL